MTPSKYQRGYSFSGYQASNPKQPLPGPQVDNELENIAMSIGQVVDGLKDVRRADGKLQNGVVVFDSISADLMAEISGSVQTLYDDAEELIETAAGYSTGIAAAAATALQAASDALTAAASLQGQLYDFNLGGAVADTDWN